MSGRNPFWEPQPDTTYVVRLGNHFSGKTKEKQKPYEAWEITVDGKLFTWFLWDNERGTAEELKAFAEDSDITVKLHFEGKNKVWDVRAAVVAGDGGKAQGHARPDLSNPEVRTAEVARVGFLYAACLWEALGIANAYNLSPLTADSGLNRLKLDHEDIRTIATTLLIQLTK